MGDLDHVCDKSDKERFVDGIFDLTVYQRFIHVFTLHLFCIILRSLFFDVDVYMGIPLKFVGKRNAGNVNCAEITNNWFIFPHKDTDSLVMMLNQFDIVTNYNKL